MILRLPALLLVAGLAATAPARAADSLDACTGFIDALPAVVGKAGTWCLRAHLATAATSGAAVTVAANSVTIDCNGYRIRGAMAPTTTTATGIVAANRANVRVRNCLVAGFATGISLSGPGHEVVDNHVEAIGDVGIVVRSTPGLIRGNRVNDVGFWGERAAARGIVADGDVDIVDNDVHRVRGANADNSIGAIRSEGGQSNVILRNRVTDVRNTLAGGTKGLQVGVGNPASRTVVRDNTLILTEGGAGTGVSCGAATVLTSGNHVMGWPVGVSAQCASHGDVVVEP